MSLAKVTDLSFAEIVEKARAHFNPKPSPIVKRYEFNTRRQGETESIATLRSRASETCSDYGSVLSDMLQDCLVCGLQKPSIQRRLLQEAALTFEKALQMSLAAEAADKDSKRLTITPLDKDLSTSIGKVNRSGRGRRQQRSGYRSQTTSNAMKPECHRCGKKHEPSQCPYKEYECHHCKKKGRAPGSQVSQEESRENTPRREREEVEPREEEEEYTMFPVTSGQTGPLHATITVNGSPLSMEIDTGASVSIAKTFETIQQGEETLELQTYTGEPIRVCGSTVVQVEHDGQSVPLPLIITEGRGPTLLGRNWLEALRLDSRTIFKIGRNLSLEQVLTQHVNVFRESWESYEDSRREDPHQCKKDGQNRMGMQR